MGCALVEVRDLMEHVTGLEVSLTGRCSLLEGLRSNSQPSDHLEHASKELWRANYAPLWVAFHLAKRVFLLILILMVLWAEPYSQASKHPFL